MSDITIIGNAIIDVVVKPIDKKIFENECTSVETLKLSYGGDALNESVVLSKLGKNVEIISKVGDDEAGSKILDFINKNNINSSKVSVDPGVETSVNLVLVNDKGERFFVSNPLSSQRRLSKGDIAHHLRSTGKIISFASMFISPLLDVPAMTEIFYAIKQNPDNILSVDLVKEKNGLTLYDLKTLIPYADFIMPNREEISALTGSDDLHNNACALIEAGCGCAVIKCGKDGCFVKSRSIECCIPAYPTKNCIDTTGAGDSFAAGFLWALSEGWSIPDCACFGTAVASCTIEHIGATEGTYSMNEAMSRFKVVKNLMRSANN
mgnify:CR=1 FL=1